MGIGYPSPVAAAWAGGGTLGTSLSVTVSPDPTSGHASVFDIVASPATASGMTSATVSVAEGVTTLFKVNLALAAGPTPFHFKRPIVGAPGANLVVTLTTNNSQALKLSVSSR